MSWLIIGPIVAVCQLVIVATMVWFRRMKAYHDRAFTEQEKRLNSGERLASAVRSKPPASQSASSTSRPGSPT
jgi:hypothetical protein